MSRESITTNAARETGSTEKKARKMALAHLNENRKRDGFPPLSKLERLWWSMYRVEWIEKAGRVEWNSECDKINKEINRR